MKKIYSFIVLILMVPFAVHSQGEYYLAKFIKKQKNKTINIQDLSPADKRVITKYASRFLPPGTPDSVKDKKVRELSSNILGKYAVTLNVNEEGSHGGGMGQDNTISKIGGLDVTNIVNGVAMLMIDRAKQELNITFFNQFQKYSIDHPEFQVLFPKTTDNLSNLLSFKYPEMLPALRTGFFEDLDNLTIHLDDVLELPKYRDLLNKFPEIKVSIKSLQLIQELESGSSNIAEILSELASFQEWNAPDISKGMLNFGSTVKLANIISESLREPTDDETLQDEDTRIWIPFDSVKALIKDSTLFSIYFDLVKTRIANENIIWDANGKKIDFAAVLDSTESSVFLFQSKIREFSLLAEKVDVVVDSFVSGRAKGTLTIDNYMDYVDVSLDVMDYGFSVAQIFDNSINVQSYSGIMRNAGNLCRNIYKKKYTQAISNAIKILEVTVTCIKEDHFNNEAEIKKAGVYKAGTTDNSRQLAFAVNAAKMEELIKALEWLNKYGLFMANMIDAQSPEEVQDVLDNAILPVGSSSIKKHAVFNLSIQSYLGAFCRIDNKNDAVNNAWNDRFGVTAPIGISASVGMNKAGSLSLFASLFDIGAIVDYQLQKDTVITSATQSGTTIQKDYSIKLEQIISPGFYLVYGCGGNIPLALGAGAQYGPGLGKIDLGTNGLLERNPSWRFNVFLAVDLPFFNLWNVTKGYDFKKKP